MISIHQLIINKGVTDSDNDTIWEIYMILVSMDLQFIDEIYESLFSSALCYLYILHSIVRSEHFDKQRRSLLRISILAQLEPIAHGENV